MEGAGVFVFLRVRGSRRSEQQRNDTAQHTLPQPPLVCIITSDFVSPFVMSDSKLSPRDFVIRIALVRSKSTTARELNPSVWRLVKLSAHLKPNVLHDKILAPVMGWTRNYHTYTFSDGRKTWLEQNTSAPDLMHASMVTSGNVLDPADARLGDLLKKVGDMILYTYDLGDGWYHKIELLEILPKKESNGACVVQAGAMRCPDEDGEGCNTYQEDVLNLVLEMKKNPHDHDTARKLAKNCFGRHNALNVRGRFDPNEFSKEKAQAAVDKALNSRASAMEGTKQFTNSLSPFAGRSFCPTRAGQRVITTEVEDDRGGDGFHLTMSETINLKPDGKDHTACLCGNPLNLAVCSGCQVVHYCSVDCQRKHWRQKSDQSHKAECKKEKATKKMCDEEAKDWSNNKPAQLKIQGERIPLVKFRDKLRFKIGAVVECMIGEGLWANGVIVDTHYRQEPWPFLDACAPYQIELASENKNLFRGDGMPPEAGKLIFAIWDDDYQIRKLPEDGKKRSPGIAKTQMAIVD